MQLLEKVRKTEFLGKEFLAWLWFRTETERGTFKLDDKSIEIWFDGKITLQGENERGLETITCSGESQKMKAARFRIGGKQRGGPGHPGARHGRQPVDVSFWTLSG